MGSELVRNAPSICSAAPHACQRRWLTTLAGVSGGCSGTQVRLMIGYSVWHVTTRKKVEKEPENDKAPLSPNTFRYSPSSVHLERTIGMASSGHRDMV